MIVTVAICPQCLLEAPVIGVGLFNPYDCQQADYLRFMPHGRVLPSWPENDCVGGWTPLKPTDLGTLRMVSA